MLHIQVMYAANRQEEGMAKGNDLAITCTASNGSACIERSMCANGLESAFKVRFKTSYRIEPVSVSCCTLVGGRL